MNIISSVIGLSIIGTAMPMIANISLQPVIAQKRAMNFGVAESAAVAYAATNEGKTTLSATPSACTDPVELTEDAYSITCTEGAGTQFVQTVTRSFRLMPPPSCDDNDGDNGHGNSGGYDCSNPGNSGFVQDLRVFDFPSPPGFTGHQCLITDNWGLDTDAFDREKNKWKGKSCIPDVAWHSTLYHESDPNAWMYDINGHNGYGDHADY